jgi:hypothetical protein
MSISESLLVALVCLTLVVVALACLCGIIILFSRLLGVLTKKDAKPSVSNNDVESEFTTAGDLSTGELKLKNVDERTAAMIMAIVSDESGIPLSELIFKSIKLIESDK